MDNVFEALKFIFGEALFSEYKNETSNKVRECNAIVYRALAELKQIKESNPSEALETIANTDICNVYANTILDYCQLEYEVVKQELLKAQENEKILNVIFEKNFNVEFFKNVLLSSGGFFEYEEYEKVYTKYGKEKLTEEEFTLLKLKIMPKNIYNIDPYIKRLHIDKATLLASYGNDVATCAKVTFDKNNNSIVDYENEIDVYTIQNNLFFILKKIEENTNTKVIEFIDDEDEPGYLLKLSNGEYYHLQFDDPDNCK